MAHRFGLRAGARCVCVCVCVRVWRGGLVAWWFGGVVAWWRALEPDKATLYGDRIVVALGRGGSDALQTVGDTLHRPVRADGLVLHQAGSRQAGHLPRPERGLDRLELGLGCARDQNPWCDRRSTAAAVEVARGGGGGGGARGGGEEGSRGGHRVAVRGGFNLQGRESVVDTTSRVDFK